MEYTDVKEYLRLLGGKFSFDDKLQEESGTITPRELFKAASCIPEDMAKLIFPAHLYHIGALVPREEVKIPAAPEVFRTFDRALVNRTISRQKQQEIKFCIFPEELRLRLGHGDEHYFEVQREGTNSCGINSLKILWENLLLVQRNYKTLTFYIIVPWAKRKIP